MRNIIKNIAIGVGLFVGLAGAFAGLVAAGHAIAGPPGIAAGVFTFGALACGSFVAIANWQ